MVKPNFRVQTRGSSLRRLSKLWYLSRVEAWYWKPLIAYTQFTIFSLTRVCSSTLISTRAYTITYSYKHLFCSKRLIIELFSKNDTRSSYSPKFGQLTILLFEVKVIKLTYCFEWKKDVVWERQEWEEKREQTLLLSRQPASTVKKLLRLFPLKLFSSLHWPTLVFFYALFIQWSIITINNPTTSPTAYFPHFRC